MQEEFCAMSEFVRRCRADQAHTDDSKSDSEFELQPLSRKTAELAGDSSSGDQWSESSS